MRVFGESIFYAGVLALDIAAVVIDARARQLTEYTLTLSGARLEGSGIGSDNRAHTLTLRRAK